jgi:hypothetical protein
MTSFICAANYAKLFEEITNHMMLLTAFVTALFPKIIKSDAMEGVELLKGIHQFEGMTPTNFFETFENNTGVLPKFLREVSTDLADIADFYNLSFAELRSGKTKRDRILRIHEYS